MKAVYGVGKHKESQAEEAELSEIKRTAPKFQPPIPIKGA